MREVAPGDIVFSFVDGYIKAISLVQSLCYESPKPEEFGSSGENWSAIGWRVNLSYTPLQTLVRPKNNMDKLRTFLPVKYSPLTADGNGLQGIYLAAISDTFAHALANVIGEEARNLLGILSTTSVMKDGILISALEVKERWEETEETKIVQIPNLSETEKETLIRARRGQGLFREQVLNIEKECRVTHIRNPRYLIASHIKPWRHSKINGERLDGENGLMLCPNIDLLFDRGLISFENNGDIILSPVADRDVLERMAVTVSGKMNVGGFSEGQKHYLSFHRDDVLLKVASA
jgi:hypothetical protein